MNNPLVIGTGEADPRSKEPLWDHQREAVKRLTAEFSSAGRVTTVMPCGTGKTRVGAEVSRLVAPSDPVLIVVPTLDLVAQTLSAWARTLGDEAIGQVIAVCGEKEVRDRDAAEDLTALRVEVTSDPVRLADLLRASSGRSTVAVTYQSLSKVVDAHRLGGVMPWRLIVVDEAHRSAGAAGRQWSMIHDDGLVPAAFRLYMTATPRLVVAREGDLSQVVSMDDGKIFGRVGYRLSYATARAQGLLADYQVLVAVVTDEEVHRLVSDGEGAPYLELGSSALSAPVLARQIAVLQSAREYGIRRMLTYHHRVRDARWFSQTLPKADALLGLDAAGALTTGFVHGSQSRRDRRAELAKLSDPGLDRVVISNSRVLQEGYNAPMVGGVAFIDCRKSTIDNVQAVGRALRLGDEKEKTAYILVPVLMGAGQEPVSALEDSAYAPVWNVVSALAAHDDDLRADLEARRRELGASSYHPDRNTLSHVPDWLHISGMPVPDRFAEAITTQAVRSTTDSWEEHVGAAAAYAAEHGDLLVRNYFVTQSGLALGQWIHWARRKYKHNMLSPARVSQLEEIGMVWDAKEAVFMRNLAAAAEYRARNGHLRVPYDFATSTPEGFSLGQWIHQVRGRKEKLSSWQRNALDELGMLWNTHEEDWAQGIAAARAYRLQNGHLRVQRKELQEMPERPEGYPLGSWISHKRKAHKGGKLTKERVDELNALGMIWNPVDDQWHRYLAAAQAFHERHGVLAISLSHVEELADGEKLALGQWLQRQHRAIRAGKLDTERAAAIKGLGRKVDTNEQAWLRAMTFARLWHKRFGNLDVPASRTISNSDGEEFRIGAWVSKARSRHNRGQLSAERVKDLDALGMIWDVQAVQEYRRTGRHPDWVREHRTP
ncbi:Helicase associated domain protein [Streptomyces sp. NPDC001890]|uniref:DEAD/DEAH box helicase n=1 Tax=Streptomyces sp. NPDC001890 TaxID=3364620 RepID=UPI00368C9909